MGMTQSVGTLVILGASGDLSSRLLLPAVGQLLTNHPERRFHLVGSGMEDWTDAHWRSVVKASFATTGSKGPPSCRSAGSNGFEWNASTIAR